MVPGGSLCEWAQFLNPLNRHTTATLLAALCFAVFVPPVTAQSTAEVARQSRNAVVTLTVLDSAGGTLGHGSGFILADGRIVTNAHVVSNASRVDVHGLEERYLGTIPYASAVSEAIDIAILPGITGLPASLRFAQTAPQVGESVIVIGAPLGLSHTVSTGIVSAVRTIRGTTYLQITAPISPGSSGGPVLNSQGEVVGVTVSTIEEGQSLNFAVIASNVERLVASPHARMPFPASTHASSSRGTAATRTEPDLRALHNGSVIYDRLRSTDPTLDDGSHYHAFTLTGSAGDRYRLTLSAPSFDAYLFISEPESEWLEEDDDGAGETDAALIITLPVTGTYLVVATSYGEGESGSYTLTVTKETEARGQSSGAQWVSYGGSFKDETREYNPGSVRPYITGELEVWIRTSYRTARQDTDGPEYDRILLLVRINCSRRQVGVVSMASYKEERLVDSSDYSQSYVEMSAIIPDSMGDGLARRICSEQ